MDYTYIIIGTPIAILILLFLVSKLTNPQQKDMTPDYEEEDIDDDSEMEDEE